MKRKRLLRLSVLVCTLLLGTTSTCAQDVKKYLTDPAPGELVTGTGIENINSNVYWTESPDGTYGAYFDLNKVDNKATGLLVTDSPFANVDVNSGFTISLESYLGDLKTTMGYNYSRFLETATYWNDGNHTRQHFFAWVAGAGTGDTPYGQAHLMSEFHLYSSDYMKVDVNNNYVRNSDGKIIVDEENGVLKTLRESERYEGSQARQSSLRNYSLDKMWHNFMLSIKADGTQSCYVDGKLVYNVNGGSAVVNHLKIIHEYQFVSLGSNPNCAENMTGWIRNVQIAPTGEMGSISMDMSTDRSLLEKLTANSAPLTKTAILIPKDVEVTLAAAKGWNIDLAKVKVLDGNGADILNRTTNKFTMPAGTVTVKFDTDDGEGGTVDPSTLYTAKTPATASFAHSSVNVTYSPNGSYNGNALSGNVTAAPSQAATWAGVTYLSSNTAVATVNATTGEVTLQGAGRAEITATVEDDDNYTYAMEKVTYTLNVSKAAGSISYGTTALNKTVGDAAFTNSLTKTGDGTVTYASSNTTLATVDANGLVTLQAGQTGTATITATVADGANYTYSTTSASYTIRVLSNGSPINIKMASDTYANRLMANNTALTATAITIPSGSEVTLAAAQGYRVEDWSKITASTNNGAFEINSTSHTFTMPVDEVTISISDASAIKTLTAGTITFSETSKTVKWGESYTLAATTTGDGTVTYTSGNANVATVNASGTVTLVGIGTTVITATAAEGTNYYYPTPTATYTLTVEKADATVTAVPTANSLSYTGSSQELITAGTASTGGQMQYKLGNGSYGTAIPQARDAGTYVVLYKAVGNPTDKYNDSEEGTLYVTIGKVASSVTAPTAASLTYTGSAQELIATVATGTGGIVVYGLGNNNINQMQEVVPTATDAGDYTVYYAVAGDDNHNDTEVSSVAVSIAKKSVTVSGITAEDKVYDGNTTATLTYTGVSFESKVDGDELTVSGTGAFADANAGTDKTVNISGLTLAGSSAGNYQLVATGQQETTTAQITAKALSVTAEDKTKDAGESDPALTYTSNGLVTGYSFTGALSRAEGESVGTYSIMQGDLSAGNNYTINFTSGTLTIQRALGIEFGTNRSWATYFAAENLAKPEGMNVYAVTSVSGNELTLSDALDYIPANVGVLLSYTGEGSNFKAQAYTETTQTVESILQGSTSAQTLTEQCYILYNNEFVLATGTSQLAANRCYLPASALTGTNARLKIVAGDATAVNAAKVSGDDEQWYTLDGRKFSGKPTKKGVYVKDGNKVIIK